MSKAIIGARGRDGAASETNAWRVRAALAIVTDAIFRARRSNVTSYRLKKVCAWTSAGGAMADKLFLGGPPSRAVTILVPPEPATKLVDDASLVGMKTKVPWVPP